jgi:hypothetical protein
MTADDERDASHAERVPLPLETLVNRLGELRVVFGESGATTVASVEDDLRRAVAARDRGAHEESIQLIARGMDRLARLADGLDPHTGAAMRLVIDRFRTALLRGHESDAREAADVMREMSGAQPVDDERWPKRR